MFEDFRRLRSPTAARYWEGDIEFDLVQNDPSDEKALIVSEVKWKRLTPAERRKIETSLEQRWQRSALRHQYAKARFTVLDMSVLMGVRNRQS